MCYDAKQKKRVRIARVLNGKQNSAVYGAAAHRSGELHVARGTGYGNYKQSGGPLVLQSGGTTCGQSGGTAFRGDQLKYDSPDTDLS